MDDFDQQLRQNVLRELTAQSCCAGRDLHVGVVNGIVHLSGSAASCEERSLLEELILSLTGVLGVVNRIEAPGAPSPGRTIWLDADGGELEG